MPTPTGADNATPVEGLFTGGGPDQLIVQLIGSLTCIVVVGAAALLLMFGIRQLPGSWNLRLARDEELEGIDIVEHGLTAYHMEFGAGATYTTYSGAPLPEQPAETESV